MVSLRLKDCEHCVLLPSLGQLPSLKHLTISGMHSLRKVDPKFYGDCSLSKPFQSLEILIFSEMLDWEEWGLPSSLHGLEIWECAKLVARRKEWDLQRLPYLTHFIISGEYEEDVLESFPEEGLLPSSLVSLCIQSLPNLKSLNNKGLEHLGSLKNMRIAGCPQLQSLPKEGLPTSLLLLEISECLLLKPRCFRDQGQDWHKIARIPLLHTDSELSFDQRTVGPTQPYSLFSAFDTAIF
ncbi:putative disease resistance protein [Camellia lanceoleosa]|uniref:Disease resistance protein n=1 Tax=Camellia lanceoleosa TaxID=1840588 RepID=A0ACC0HKB2_9ERIC|nr:putative disease resistance protein [Camellia lanceoleosa]